MMWRANTNKHRYRYTPRTYAIKLLSVVIIGLTHLQSVLLLKKGK